MNIANKITYFATDEQRQVIPWVRMEDAERQGDRVRGEGRRSHSGAN